LGEIPTPLSAMQISAEARSAFSMFVRSYRTFLSLAEIGQILGRIGSAAILTAILVAAVMGLRRSEVSGLKWCDLDFNTLWLSLRRGRVRCHNTKLKTEASRKGIPIPQHLADALMDWRQQSLYQADDDWVFASPTTGGRTPMWLDVALQRHIRPRYLRLGSKKLWAGTRFAGRWPRCWQPRAKKSRSCRNS
jgi:integrase